MSLFKHKKNVEEKKKSNLIQENQEECIKLIENGFLKDVFNNETITDVSYNGESFYALDNDKGRYRLKIEASSEEIFLFIKQISNYMLHPFSFHNPSLDVSFGPYRLNAIHPSFARTNNKKVITFSLRKITPSLKIKENDISFCPLEVHNLLKCLILAHQSILISGQTGSGKTEFQKYLISLMNNSDRLIMIEESYETQVKEIFKEKDITCWIVNNNNQDELSYLVKVALRNNPDWLIIAETRGKEAYDMVQAVMTGHSAVTTIHTESAKFSINRIVNMCKKSVEFDEKTMSFNIANHFKIGIHLEKIFDSEKQKYVRRICEIIEYIPKDNGYEINPIFEIIKDENLKEKLVYRPISSSLKSILIKNNIKVKTLDKFYKEVKKNEKKKTKKSN